MTTCAVVFPDGSISAVIVADPTDPAPAGSELQLIPAEFDGQVVPEVWTYQNGFVPPLIPVDDTEVSL